jgi:lactate dehydrogenase-like 2-hydroxyacid dehydrogenase
MFWPFKKNRSGKVRLGIIGMGNIGKLHADYLPSLIFAPLLTRLLMR